MKKNLGRERRGMAGVDEAGRGALSGPVVAAAVILDEGITRRNGLWRQVRDSKSLTPDQRSVLVRYIRANVLDFGVGLATHKEIDALNILQASLLAMRRAVEGLKRMPRELLIDGKNKIPLLASPNIGEENTRSLSPPSIGGVGGGISRWETIEQRAIINGDAKILAISAASIIAKVFRDELMIKFGEKFPEYGFERHKGYGTALHFERLKHHGPCPIHRMTFAPVRRINEKNKQWAEWQRG